MKTTKPSKFILIIFPEFFFVWFLVWCYMTRQHLWLCVVSLLLLAWVGWNMLPFFNWISHPKFVFLLICSAPWFHPELRRTIWMKRLNNQSCTICWNFTEQIWFWSWIYFKGNHKNNFLCFWYCMNDAYWNCGCEEIGIDSCSYNDSCLIDLYFCSVCLWSFSQKPHRHRVKQFAHPIFKGDVGMTFLWIVQAVSFLRDSAFTGRRYFGHVFFIWRSAGNGDSFPQVARRPCFKQLRFLTTWLTMMVIFDSCCQIIDHYCCLPLLLPTIKKDMAYQ